MTAHGSLLAECSLLRTYAERVTLLVPQTVYADAAAKELQKVHPDAALIARCEEAGLLERAAVRSRRKLPLEMGAGEAAAIRLFLEREADLIVADDRRALRTCRLLDIPFTTAPRVAVGLCMSGAIPSGRARRALEKLAVLGRYSREIIAAALLALQEARDDETDDDSPS